MSKIVSFWILHSWFQGTGSLPVRLTWRVMLLRSSSSFIRSAVQPSSHAAKNNKKACSKITVDEEGVTKYELSMQTLNRNFFKNYTKNKIITLKIFLHTYRHIFHPPRHVAADIHHICLQLFLEDTDTGPGGYRKTIPSPQNYNHTANNDHQLVLGSHSNHQHICHETFENICTTQK